VENESPVTERFNRSVTQFSTASNPIEARAIANYAARPMPELPVSAFQVKGGVTFAGVGGNDRGYWDRAALNWMPRIGLAYQLRPRTVLRAGYGLFFGSLGVMRINSNQAGFTRTTPIQASNDNGLTYLTTLTNPLPAGLLPVQGASAGLETTLGQGTAFFAAKRTPPYAQRWSAGFQQELPGRFVLDASYVGNRSTHLPITRSMSYVPRQFLSTLPYRDVATINFLSANFPSPFFGLNPQFTGSNISRGQLLTQYPHFSSVNFDDQVGYSWYHSLQMSAEKRFSRGFTFQMAYTWSKAMEATSFLNAQDPMPYETLGDIDRLHRATGSGIWEVPVGKGRRFGASLPSFLEFFAGGWQLSGVFQFQSGSPLGFGQALLTGDSTKIALGTAERNPERWFNTDVFNRSAADVLGSNIRTAPLRYSNIRADSQRRLDGSLNKTFRITERFKMVFRADAFNARNDVVLRGPNTDPTNSAFGRVTAQEPPRSWQFSLTLKF
jgi:hypothetical protein